MNLLQMIHFERPYWLLLIPIVWLIFAFIRYKGAASSNIGEAIDKNLLIHLEQEGEQSHLNKWLGLMCVTLCLVGLAGISWVKAPSTMFESTSKTVFIVDQSLSMYATDIKPNRQTRLKQTIQDILQQTKDGNIALVAFAGDAYTISPFSQDKNTITHFLLALEPIIMPVYGSNLTSGIEDALSLVPNKKTPVHFVILTDSINASDQKTIPSLLADHNIKTDLIAIGSKEGGPINLPNGKILQSKNQNVIPKTPVDELHNFAKKIHANFYHGRLTASQLDKITQASNSNDKTEQASNQSIHWIDQGHWFALPFLLWMAFQFRRGMLFTLLLSVFLLPSNKATASPLDWFKTPDQLGQQAADQDNWKEANKHFKRPDWKAASDYALGQYDQAAKKLSTFSKTSADYYNLGNAQALSGKAQDAIASYKRALELDPSMKQAEDNLKYLEKQQKKQQSDKSKANKKSSNTKQNQKEQNQKQSKEDEQKSSDSQNSNPQNNTNNKPSPKKSNKAPEKQDKKPSPEDNKQTPEQDQSKEKPTAQPELNREQQQALKQWLRQIQDTPGTLLQRKLWYLHQEKRQENQINQEDGLNPW